MHACIIQAQTYACLFSDINASEAVYVVEEQQDQGLEERDLQLLLPMPQGGLQHALAQRWLPLQLAAVVLVHVETLECR